MALIIVKLWLNPKVELLEINVHWVELEDNSSVYYSMF